MARFANDADDFAITDRSRRDTYSYGIQVDKRQAAITFADFYDLPANDYYWLLPEKFLGNKVFISTDNFFLQLTGYVRNAALKRLRSK